MRVTAPSVVPTLLLLLLAALVPSASAAACSDAVPNVLSAVCGGVCGEQALCVHRDHKQDACALLGNATCVSEAACSVDCVALEPAATAWTIVWTAAGALVVTSDAADRSTTTVVHDPVLQLDARFSLPVTLRRLSISGTPTATLRIPDVMVANFSQLAELYLENVNLSSWTTLPDMANLRKLSLNHTALQQWPRGEWPSELESLSMNENPVLEDATMAFPSTLQTLSLCEAGLKTLPNEFADLKFLQQVNLDGNALQLPEAALPLPATVSSISMRDCQLPRVPLDFNALPKLRTLDLSWNPELSTTLPVLPYSVRYLRLAGCGLTAFPIEQLETLPLATLDLSGNDLAETDVVLSSRLAAFPSLSALDLSATNRSSVPLTSGVMKRLTQLSLASNAIRSVNETSIPSSVEHLNLAYNPQLTLALPSTLRLRTLNVSHCDLATLSIPPSSAATLSFLDASGNVLADAATAALPSSLRSLNLSSNRLTLLPSSIFNLSALEHLDLRGNPIPSEAVTSLSATQIQFLHRLHSLAVDPGIFRSANCSSPVQFSSGYSVCVARGDGSTSVDSTADARALTHRNLVIIAATIGSTVVFLTILFYLLQRGRNAADAGEALDGAGGRGGGADYSKRAPHARWTHELASGRQMTDAEWRALEMWSFWDDPEVLALRIPWDMVRDRQVIGSGRYSVLWLARVDTRAVFLKALQPTAHRQQQRPLRSGGGGADGSVAAVQSLVREIQLLRTLRHPHLVELVGVTWMNAPTDVQVVLEDMANGDLRAYLELTEAPPPPPGRWRGTWDGLAMRVALQVADALAFLHDGGIVHNDVRSRNVVLDDDCNAKLTGLGRHVFVDREDAAGGDSGQRYKSELPPPAMDELFLLDAGRWIAPELLRGHLHERRRVRASLASDVYAFGVLLLELDTFDLPFADVDIEEDDDEDESVDDPHVLLHPTGGGALHEGGVGPHDPRALRFSSAPHDHSSLLGKPGSLSVSLGTTPEAFESPLSGAAGGAAPQQIGGGGGGGGEPGDRLRLTTIVHASSHPTEEERYEAALLKRLARGLVPVQVAASCPTAVADLIHQCLDLRPERRPTIHHVRNALRALATRRSSSQRSSASTRSSTRGRSQRSSSGGVGGGGRGSGGPVPSAVPSAPSPPHVVETPDSSQEEDGTRSPFFVMPSPGSSAPSTE